MTDYRSRVDTDEPTHIDTAAFAPLTTVSIKHASDAVTQPYQNVVLVDVNQHCVRMAVMVGEYRWHHHPNSDECFLVVEGALEIDLADDRTVTVRPGELFTIPAGVRHRTRASVRTVNLCFEHARAYTDVVFEE